MVLGLVVQKYIYDYNSISNFEKSDPIPSWFLEFELELIVLTNQIGYPPNTGAYSLCLYQCCISVYTSVWVIIELFNNLQFLSLESLEIKELLVPIL
jgi:hypothetical protein